MEEEGEYMAEVLVHVTRGELVESRHAGDIAVVDSAGRVVASVGDPRVVTFWRSSAKPVQTLPVITSGAADRFKFTDEELAVMAASHDGEDRHVWAVRSILGKIGLTEKALKCGAHLPYNKAAAVRLERAGELPTDIHNNCSGKHAAMLSMAVHLGFDTERYYEPEHPVQKMILDIVSRWTGVPADQIILGTDGCGVPVFGLPLAAMALPYARLVRPVGMPREEARAAERLTRAMQAYPAMVGGTGRFCTDLMRELRPEVIGKVGAEGVYCMGIRSRGLGVALKVEDGRERAANPAALEVLRQLRVADPASIPGLSRHWRPPVENHRGEKVGEIVPVFELKREQSKEEMGTGR